jgi:hypothetical protein
MAKMLVQNGNYANYNMFIDGYMQNVVSGNPAARERVNVCFHARPFLPGAT